MDTVYPLFSDISTRFPQRAEQSRAEEYRYIFLVTYLEEVCESVDSVCPFQPNRLHYQVLYEWDHQDGVVFLGYQAVGLLF